MQVLDDVLDDILERYLLTGVSFSKLPANFEEYFDDVMRYVCSSVEYLEGSGVCPMDPMKADFTPFDGYCAEIVGSKDTNLLVKTASFITKLTGFECKFDTIEHKIATNDSFVTVKWKTWWCPDLKLAFYTDSLFVLPKDFAWLYADVKKGGTYERRHCEYQLIRERIRIDNDIMLFVIPSEYRNASEKEMEEFVRDIIHHYTHKIPFVGFTGSVGK